MITFKHSGNIGDVILSLPTVISLLERHKETEATFYLAPNVPANYSPGLFHPNGDVMMTEANCEQLIPLLKAQHYISKAEVWDGRAVDFDLDLFRQTGIDFTRGDLPRAYFYAFHANYDLSQPWLSVYVDDLTYLDNLVVSRTLRYRNNTINYGFLKQYNVLFVGLPAEFRAFKREVPNATYCEVKDFLQLAAVIASARMFIGNQSFAWTLAEAMKVEPRMLELCRSCPCIPHGPNAWDFFSQLAFERIVASLPS